MLGPTEAEGFAALRAEHDNLRSALSAMIASDDGDAALGFITGAVQRFWRVSGMLAEGRSSLERALQSTVRDERLRASGLRALASMAAQQGDLHVSAAAAGEALPVFRALGDRKEIVDTLMTLGIVAVQRGDLAEATACFSETEQISSDLGDRFRLEVSIENLGATAMHQGAYDRAMQLFERGMELADELGHDESRGSSAYNAGLCALHLGDLELARTRLRDSLTRSEAAGHVVGIAIEAHAVAALLAEQGRCELAVQIFRSADALRRELGFELDPVEQTLVERLLSVAESELGVSELKELRAAGEPTSSEVLVRLALAALD
ncbi:MAG: tetratricopeptide repeat protein [Gaiellaceae bacterium]